MSAQYDELRLTNGWDQFRSLEHPIKFQRVSCLRCCSDIAHRRPTKLCTVFDRLLGCYTIYTFWGLLSPDGILPGANFTLRSSLAFSYIGSITAQHSNSGRQPNFAAWYTRNGITELSHRAPPIYSTGRPSRWASVCILVFELC